MRRLLMAVTVVGAAGVLTVALPARAKAATAPYPYAHAFTKPTTPALNMADVASYRTTADATRRTAPAAA
ncbi:hypothetical protein AB0D09_14165 [Streptomyces sp. NPDC049097]|uniref:hypothetical protein n=1 Tax=unclassified Streptomyces TaxID=2593676 RepID=UPI0033F93115